MNYQETERWLYEKLPMFQRIGSKAYKSDLLNIIELTKYLENPQDRYLTIHVAGTNGKGSTSHMLASILQEAGYKVGLTTSPHLKDFRERIRVNGEMCSEEFIVDFVEENSAKIESLEASFFEVSIAMAFDYFAKEKVDIAVIETGLGGRLDSTNIITPVLSVITNIGMDHMNILGNTMEEIAAEKAGIIKPNVPVVIGETIPETKKIFISKAKEMQSEIVFAEENSFKEYESDLKGIYQKKNKKTVLASVEILQNNGLKIDENSIENGLKNVVKNTGLRGRWDILQNNPLIVADTAHNAHGLSEVIKQINQTKYEKLHLVLGFVDDKDVGSILKLFPENALFYFSSPDVPRKMLVENLKKLVPEKFDATYYDTVSEALEAAKNKAASDDMIYVGGSTFVVAEVI